MTTIPPELEALQRYRFQGLATSCGRTQFDLPIVSNIVGNLWQGASVGEFGLTMPDYFKTVLNLYPWVSYAVPLTTEYKGHELYDDPHSGVDKEVINNLSKWINDRLDNGPLLVHCQAGINRSALVAGYSLVLRGYEPEEAVSLMRERRGPEVLCNKAFEGWLLGQSSS